MFEPLRDNKYIVPEMDNMKCQVDGKWNKCLFYFVFEPKLAKLEVKIAENN